MSVQDTVSSDISFAAIVHLGQTVPPCLLRFILDVRDMVTVKTSEFEAPVKDGGVIAPNKAGLGLTVNRDVLGEPVAVYK